MHRHLFVLGFALLATTASIGCAADTDPSTEGGGAETEEDALTNSQLPGVVAVELAEVRAQDTVLSSKVVGVPAKVKGILTGVKKLKPSDPVPRCMERDTTRLTFLDLAGKKLATVGSYCGGFGHITFENGNAGYGVKFNAAQVDAARNAPIAVGDALWGISKIEISKPGRPESEKVTLSGEKLKPVLDGFKLDEVPDPTASFPRCLPSHAVTFKRGSSNVAFTSFLCGAASPPPASVKAQFTAPNPSAPPDSAPLASGGITIDPRPIVTALAGSSN